MSTYVNNLFNFVEALPEPFHMLTNKKVSVSSKYGSGTESTLCAAVIKAANAVCHCRDGSCPGAVGTFDHKSIAEYKSSKGADLYHIAVYDSVSGNIMASVYDTSTETSETYILNSSGRDGAAIFMTMFPTLLSDEEFSDYFEEYYDHYKKGFTDLEKTIKSAAYLCDNAYRRIKDETCAAHIKTNIDRSGNLTRVSQAQIDSGAFTPQKVLAGEFTIFAKTGRVIYRTMEIIEHSDFVGKYAFGSRVWDTVEQSLIPKLPSWYVIPQEVVDICKHAHDTTGKPTQMRNFLLRGPAGTGKTMGAKAIAAGLGLPYMKYTCSSGTEVFDCATCS